MYINRSVLLLFAFLTLAFVIGMDWIRAGGSAWYRPFLLGLGIILLSALIQMHQNHDDY